MTYIVDIDNHLIFSDKVTCKECNEFTYYIKAVDTEEVKLVNKAFKQGHKIIIHTGRSWGFYDLTKRQLDEIGVNYHDLVMGKPHGIYVDKEALTSLKGIV